ncbi:hypothetical protein [Synechococcus sp. CC9605]|uniref:hypothetical protein n=1 Tax=Synechococcus sp. (strain CC9605) TaxID=110662 RepID=UPI00005D571C|nr:hypothetical protein [Synechococcus sp. CC9605]ABB34228.1 hypothetical protein Syncc9605_0452 [Synechococcus sp. CC9605]
MTKTEIELLVKAFQVAGIDASKIAPANLFEKSGKVADMLQVAVAEIDPLQAAEWRIAADGGLSVATLAELESGQELSQQAQRDLWNHYPQFVADRQQEAARVEAQQLAWLDKEADKARRAREGDEAVDFQNAKAQAAAEARAASAKHAADMQRRIDEKRSADARMAGVMTNG